MEEDDNSDSELLSKCVEDLQENDCVNKHNNNVQNQSSDRISEKRLRESSEENVEDSFTLVEKKRAKKAKKILERRNEEDKSLNLKSLNDDNIHKVCLTSTEVLPKQMALAKILRDENINNIVKIKYKGPYKVLIHFDNIDGYEKLINCQKFTQLNIKAQSTNKGKWVYGIVRGVDIELDLEDFLKSLRQEDNVISAKRFKKIDKNGKWVEGETVRLCFQCPQRPNYVYAYGCRFEVERFVFPVTQCSKCWKFGHIKKFCPVKKDVCPKCGNEHANCEIVRFKCPNCGGPHMALNKTCPCYLKERRIRIIMSKEYVSYREALQFFLEEKKEEQEKIIEEMRFESTNTIENSYKSRTYSDAVKKVDMQEQISSTEEENIEIDKIEKSNKKKKKKIKKTTNLNTLDKQDIEVTSRPSVSGEKTETCKGSILDIKVLWRKIKDIILAEGKIEDKIICSMKVIFEGFKEVIISFLCGGDIIKKLYNG